jgi:hypothetical protein
VKRFVLVLILGAAAAAASAQQTPAQMDSVVLELQAQLAEERLTIAQLKKQISELNISLLIAQRAVVPSIDQVRDENSRNLTAAVEAAHAARVAADSAAKKTK